MHWIDWLIVIIPVALVLGIAIYAKKYVRGVVDFLAAGRAAGRYVISVGDLQAVLLISDIYLRILRNALTTRLKTAGLKDMFP